ncbi:hypothetical protein LX16_4964 [Stackebrandtia albiflava]|uniref:Uncharacterized protein n=1 Tax=Stackebrandtia albiflava TaxID=406432 RepID=A0A562UQA9_9ACTN|nr:hypothetical protein [Stackebrandtia albiflava]TWJ07800.1 hypothetical protein LX16_4964 [Stackebrandtia albiflava]
MQPAAIAPLLNEPPAGVTETVTLIGDFDEYLTQGFARPDARRADVLDGVVAGLAGTPLGRPVAEAVAKLTSGPIGFEQLSVLAGARAALWGAVHDALSAQADEAAGRRRPDWPDITVAHSADTPISAVTAARSWLNDLAVLGWNGLDHEVVSAVNQPVETLLASPEHRRLGLLLDGFAAELRACLPIATLERIPTRRWADLWTRAVLLASGHPAAEAGTVTGRFLPLGTEILEHGTVFQVRVHGLLETKDGPPIQVRASVAASKVDTILGPACWRLLSAHGVLLTALAEHRAVTLTDMPILPGGELLWDEDHAAIGDEADPFATARVRLAESVPAAVPPLERHPVALAHPVFLEGYKVGGDERHPVVFELGDVSLPVAVDRLPDSGPLNGKLVSGSAACIGLLRWDGEWLLQPLAVLAKRKGTAVHTGDWAKGPTDPKAQKAEAKAAESVNVLRERAGRLLRK